MQDVQTLFICCPRQRNGSCVQATHTSFGTLQHIHKFMLSERLTSVDHTVCCVLTSNIMAAWLAVYGGLYCCREQTSTISAAWLTCKALLFKHADDLCKEPVQQQVCESG
jgi:hypothetical protein